MTQDTDAKAGTIASWFDLAAYCSGFLLAIIEAAQKARGKAGMFSALSRISPSFDFLSLLAKQSNAEQQIIEKMVVAATPDQRNALRSEAETALTQLNKRVRERFLYHEENKAAERAIEVLVRVEAIEKGRGWWARFKRRVQIRQLYLSRIEPKPFSEFATNEVRDDAVKLMRRIDSAATKYFSMTDEELIAALPLDFPSEHYGFDLDAVTFMFSDMPDFYFTLSENHGSRSLCITGRKRFAGFTLFAPDKGYWHCSARERTAHSPPGEAKLLAQLIEKKFGIRDISSPKPLSE